MAAGVVFGEGDLAVLRLKPVEYVVDSGPDSLAVFLSSLRPAAQRVRLGGLEVLLQAEEVAALLKVPKSWVYANADQIPGATRLGRYLRFRPAVIISFLGGSEVAQ